MMLFHNSLPQIVPQIGTATRIGSKQNIFEYPGTFTTLSILLFHMKYVYTIHIYIEEFEFEKNFFLNVKS